MSRILPILFNAEMVRAILDGRKTVTRRIMKPQPLFYTGRKYIFTDNEIPKKWKGCDNIIETYKYQPGDILYVRETWCRGSLNYHEEQYFYKADNNDFHCRWHPSIHMPKEAARIWLKCTDVRIEQLQEMIASESAKEGIRLPKEYDTKERAYILGFADLWDSTIKKSDLSRYGWDANPFVWVIEFERCEKPER